MVENIDLDKYISPVAEFRVDRNAVGEEATTTGRPYHEVYEVYKEVELARIVDALATEAPERHGEVLRRVERLRHQEGYVEQCYETALRSLLAVRQGTEDWWFSPKGFYRGFPEEVPDEEVRRELLAATAERQWRSCGMPPVFWGMELKDVEPRPDIESFAEAVRVATKQDGHWLFIRGNPGVGKSLLAALLAKRTLREGLTVIWTSAARYIEATKPNGDTSYVDRCYGSELFVVDDLGQERQTEYAVTEWDMLISHRYDNGLPLAVTTNLSADRFAVSYGQRVVDRLRDCCQVFDLIGTSYRGRNR